jgi:HAD superfamily hydrolase (TIGR01484 family)
MSLAPPRPTSIHQLTTRYRAVVTDLDGTAVPAYPRALPSKAVVDAVAAATTAGLLVTVATGRPWPAAKRVVDHLGITGPILIDGGSRIVQATTGETLYEKCFSPAARLALALALANLPYDVLLDDDTHDDASPALHRLSELRNTHRAVWVIGVPVRESERLAHRFISAHTAVSITTNPAGDLLKDIQITPRGATKQSGVAHLLALLDVEKAHSVGVGDSANDTPLFNAVGLRIAMSQGSSRLKVIADVIAPSILHDGLAWVLENLATDTTARSLWRSGHHHY